jgi:hypothetical protein
VACAGSDAQRAAVLAQVYRVDDCADGELGQQVVEGSVALFLSKERYRFS